MWGCRNSMVHARVGGCKTRGCRFPVPRRISTAFVNECVWSALRTMGQKIRRAGFSQESATEFATSEAARQPASSVRQGKPLSCWLVRNNSGSTRQSSVQRNCREQEFVTAIGKNLHTINFTTLTYVKQIWEMCHISIHCWNSGVCANCAIRNSNHGVYRFSNQFRHCPCRTVISCQFDERSRHRSQDHSQVWRTS